MKRAAIVALFVLALPAVAGSTVTAKKAALSTAHPLATKAGLAILQKGGNAIDASVAVAFALAVVHPQAGNLGGGGFLVYYDASSRGVWTLDFREVAPLATKREQFATAQKGALAAGVPGTVAGLNAMHRKFGTKPWKDLLGPALALTRETRVDPELEADRKSKNVELPKPAELAYTLQRLADHGAKDFYDGDLSKQLVEAVRAAGGILGHRDLREYEPVWRAPLKLRYGPYDIHTVPPPSGGGLVIAETLNILAADDLAATGFQSTKSLHLLIEAQRRAAVDRMRYVGDPHGTRLPYRELLSQSRAQAWRKSIDMQRATATASLTEPRNLQVVEGSQTTHFTIADEKGNVASLTTSLGDLFGSGFSVPSLGFFLNNAMNDFTSGVNIADAAKRPATSMAPVIVLREGKPFLALGTRGGAAIPTTILQVFLNVAVYGKSLPDAVAAPRYHHQGIPEETMFEHELAPRATIDALNAMSHGVSGSEAIGDVHAILFEKGRMIAVADPRRGGAAGGY